MTAPTLELPPAGETVTRLVEGPATRIEVLLQSPAGAARGGCVVCHPHPLFGGAMTNKVVYSLASTALKGGFATLRFNFRGVGQSTGEHDQTRGEAEDTVFLAQALCAALPAGSPLVLAGFSFGAYVSLLAAPRVAATALMSVAPPFALTREIYGFEGAPPPHPGCPWAAIHSRDDDTVSYAATAGVLAGYDPPPVLTTVDGAGHFFHGRLAEVSSAFAALLERATPHG
jgi:alpha/beta superfamily hydrolase